MSLIGVENSKTTRLHRAPNERVYEMYISPRLHIAPLVRNATLPAGTRPSFANRAESDSSQGALSVAQPPSDPSNRNRRCLRGCLYSRQYGVHGKTHNRRYA